MGRFLGVTTSAVNRAAGVGAWNRFRAPAVQLATLNCEAAVARRSLAALLRKGRAVVVEAVARVDPVRAAALQAEYVPPASDPEPRGDEAARSEGERTARLLEAVADLPDATVRARVTQVRTLLAGEGDRVVSFDDPDARWGDKAPDKPFCGDKAHEALDPDSRLITAVDVVPGNAHEAVRTDAVLAAETPPLAEATVIIGDGLSNNATTVAPVEEAGARPCFLGPTPERVSDGFPDDGATDQMGCPEGQRSIGTVRVDNGDLSSWSLRNCAACPRQAACVTRGEREGTARPRRRVYPSDVRKQRELAGEAGKAWRKAHLKLRGRIEPKCDEQIHRHGLRSARYWGLAEVTVPVLLNVITVNAKRAVKLLAQAAGRPGAGRRLVEVLT